MKKSLLALVLLALPSICGSGEYSRTICKDSIVENRGGLLLVKQRSELSKKIESFALEHGADEELAVEMAELLGALENGKVLAAIAAQESRFDIRAVGQAGEIGAYQVLSKFWGEPGDTFKSQTDKANSILEELLNASNGDLTIALERYNGTGCRSKKYASRVLSLIEKI